MLVRARSKAYVSALVARTRAVWTATCADAQLVVTCEVEQGARDGGEVGLVLRAAARRVAYPAVGGRSPAGHAAGPLAESRTGWKGEWRRREGGAVSDGRTWALCGHGTAGRQRRRARRKQSRDFAAVKCKAARSSSSSSTLQILSRLVWRGGSGANSGRESAAREQRAASSLGTTLLLGGVGYLPVSGPDRGQPLGLCCGRRPPSWAARGTPPPLLALYATSGGCSAFLLR